MVISLALLDAGLIITVTPGRVEDGIGILLLHSCTDAGHRCQCSSDCERCIHAQSFSGQMVGIFSSLPIGVDLWACGLSSGVDQ